MLGYGLPRNVTNFLLLWAAFYHIPSGVISSTLDFLLSGGRPVLK